jgi:hypothetical protein
MKLDRKFYSITYVKRVLGETVLKLFLAQLKRIL